MARENFKSGLGSILALAGSAVGLGNIWRFPYMLSEYGGGAFIIVYLLCILIVALPIMLSEFIVGRGSRRSAYSAVGHLEPKGPWKHFGVLVVLIPFATLCYYCIIGGWTLDYLLKSITLQFSSGTNPEAIEREFGSLVSAPIKPLLFDALFLAATCLIIMLGVHKGIEKFSKIMMPLLFFIMLFIAVWTISLPGAGEGLGYLFRPDFGKISPQVCIAAMGQSFYSLSIGMGIMITYGSYLSKDDDLKKTAVCTVASDFVFALIAGCAIIPALFAYGMPTGQGTGLVFKTLPVVFSQMPLGNFVAIVFFFAVLLAALTSAMSLCEVAVSWFMEKFRMTRKKSCVLTFVIALAVGSLCSLSFGPLSGFTVKGKILFDLFDYSIGNFLMPFAGLVLVIFVGWKMKRAEIYREMFNGESRTPAREFTFRALYTIIRYISPAAIIAIFLSGIIK